MKLLEYKGKELLQKAGIAVPKGIVVDSNSLGEVPGFLKECNASMIKAQVLSTGRKKAGLIVEANNAEDAKKKASELLSTTFNNAPIEKTLVEEKISAEAEHYLSITYDTAARKPMIVFLKKGGIDVEESEEKLLQMHFSANRGLSKEEAKAFAGKAGLDDSFAELLLNAVKCFQTYDCRILEINPIFRTTKGYVAGDAKLTIDDSAAARQPLIAALPPEKTFLTEREIEARKIDASDYRGVAGKTFVELDGDIAVLASGGGASLTCMDALIEAGGRPANYTEYSGNPPKEKVKKLTQITLSRKGLNGCLVIGGTANFTDIFATLSGFVEGLKSLPEKPMYPIIIRRAGPRDAEAKQMIQVFAKMESYDITFFGEETPMTVAVKIMVDKARKFKEAEQ